VKGIRETQKGVRRKEGQVQNRFKKMGNMYRER
jgi:hypothetical protein